MSKQNTNGLLPYPVIVAATHGDVDAINAVLKHYEGYKPLCQRGVCTTKTASPICVLTRDYGADWKPN